MGAKTNDRKKTPPGAKDRTTVKAAAAVTGVSERSLYMTRRVMRLGRRDLLDAMGRGEITIHKALMLAEGRRPPTRYEKLVRAWNIASDVDRRCLLKAVGVVIDDAPDHLP